MNCLIIIEKLKKDKMSPKETKEPPTNKIPWRDLSMVSTIDERYKAKKQSPTTSEKTHVFDTFIKNKLSKTKMDAIKSTIETLENYDKISETDFPFIIEFVAEHFIKPKEIACLFEVPFITC